MLIWTNTAMEVLREASAKAEDMNHLEVHPLHLLWAATGRIGIDALRRGENDRQLARLRFQVERDLYKLPTLAKEDGDTWGECATPGFKMQRLLLRAADYSTGSGDDSDQGQVGLPELMKALMQDVLGPPVYSGLGKIAS